MNKKELLKEIKRAAEDNETELNLAGEDLTSLPPEIGRLTDLTWLDLDNNRLRSVLV